MTLKEYDPFRPVDTVNLADVAWFRHLNPITVDQSVGVRGKWPRGEVDLIGEFRTQPSNKPLWLAGRSSGIVSGAMTAIRSCVIIQNGGKGYYFEDQIEVTMSHLGGGDSGSLVLTDLDMIGGLFFAIDSSPSGIGFANPWQAVKTATGLSFSYM